MHIIQTVREMQRWSEDQRLGRKDRSLCPYYGLFCTRAISAWCARRRIEAMSSWSPFSSTPCSSISRPDFDKYPRNEAEDERALKELGTDVLFMPPPAEIYPDGYQSAVLRSRKVSQPLCGCLSVWPFSGG